MLVILSDDVGWGEYGFQGGKDIPTPNIDSIAKNGVRCSQGYVSGPYCSPLGDRQQSTREELLNRRVLPVMQRYRRSQLTAGAIGHAVVRSFDMQRFPSKNIPGLPPSSAVRHVR